MLLLQSPSSTTTTDSSSALVVRRLPTSGLHPDAAPKLASHLMIGRSRCYGALPTSGFVCFHSRTRQQLLLACNALNDWYHYLSIPKRRGHLVATRASFSPTGPLEPGNRPPSWNARAHPIYHHSEDIMDGPGVGRGEDEKCYEDRRLTDAEIARTVVEVNDKATLIFSESIDDEIDEKILWPELSYITDEHGGIYIEVTDEEEILKTLTENDNLVQVLIGIDNIEKIAEVELSGPMDIHFGTGEFMEEELEPDDDFEQDIEITDFDDADDENYDDFSSEPFIDWTNLETMKSSHPVYFAKKIAEAVSNIQFDWMEQPSTNVVIQGFLRPASVEDHSMINRLAPKSDGHQLDKIPRSNSEDIDDGSHRRHKTFYKVELITIQLASAYGDMSMVKVQDYRLAQPDAIALSAARIISRLKSGGEETAYALKSLCLRCKGLHVEEVDLTSVDSLGFDLRACSGTQIQNLRFSFKTRATSEYSAEQQLNDLLFPRLQIKNQGKTEAPHVES